MSIFLFGQKADRTHENKMLRVFIKTLKADWGGAGKDITLIANSMWDGHEVDLVCMLPKAVLVVDFKHYSGHLIGTENGEWTVDGAEVKGGSSHRTNPFQQIRDYKFAIIDWLKRQRLLKNQNIGHINGAVVFTGPITGEIDLSIRSSYWFHTTDLERCPTTLADLASDELTVTRRDIIEIIRALGVRKIHEDYGQANRGTAQLSRSPTVVATTSNQSSIYLNKSSVVTPSYKNVDAFRAAPIAQRASTVAIVPARKRGLSRLFKSAAVVGGVFLTLAVVSQIYPMIAQSSIQLADELIQKVESMKTAVNTSGTQPKQAAVATQKKTITPVKSYIETRLVSSYVGREVTACGRVAQYVPFEKGAYLHFDKPSPQQTVTLVLWEHMLGSIENKIGRVNSLVGVDLCAHGYIERDNTNLHMQIADLSTVQLKSNYLSAAANKK